jgi:HSP20 family protein
MATNLNYNPYRAINQLQQQMEQLWGEAMGAQTREAAAGWQPVVDIFETEAELTLLSELPGVEQSDIKLSIDNNVLTLSGERKLADSAKQLKTHRQERPMGAFQRSFSLPANFDLGKISANYNNGILKISLPKKAEARPRQIPVKVK